MTTRWIALAAIALLAAVWLGPLPGLAERSFTAHMVLHVFTVAIVPPLLALALVGSRYDPGRRQRLLLFLPFPASIIEVLVVWIWHLPVPHQASLDSALVFSAEQVSYLLAGLLVWIAAFGKPEDPNRSAAGIGALLFTSMHMTLLGVLIATSPRLLYEHRGVSGVAPLVDQQIGGIIMLAGAGSIYLAGGLLLLGRLLHRPPQRGKP